MHNSKAREHYLELVEKHGAFGRRWRSPLHPEVAENLRRAVENVRGPMPVLIPERGRYRLAERFRRKPV